MFSITCFSVFQPISDVFWLIRLFSNEQTALPIWIRVGGMKTIRSTRERSRTAGVVCYTLALLLVLLAPILGLTAALVVVWHLLLAGTFPL